MEFLGIGLPELLVILLVALLVVGPQRLPQTAVQIARFIRQVRHYATEVTEQLREEMDKLEAEYEAAQGDLRRAREELEQARKEVGRLAAEAAGLSEDELERVRQETEEGAAVPALPQGEHPQDPEGGSSAKDTGEGAGP